MRQVRPPSPLVPPTLRSDLQTYPPSLQTVKVLGGTVSGPSGYGSSSFLGPVLYLGETQQLRTDDLTLRSREPCLVLDANGVGLGPGYYEGRLSGSYNALPVYVVGGAGGQVAAVLPGLTPAQLAQLLINLNPTQIAKLDNLNSCQLQTFITLPPANQQRLTNDLTRTEISTFIDGQTSTQLSLSTTTLSTDDIRTFTDYVPPYKVPAFINVLPPLDIQRVFRSLTSSQASSLSIFTDQEIYNLTKSLTTTQLKTFLDQITPPTSQGVIDPPFIFTGRSPVNVSTTQNNYDLRNTIYAAIKPTVNNTQITGFLPSSPQLPQLAFITNVSPTLNLLLKRNSASSTYPILIPGGGDYSISPNVTVPVFFDPGLGAWVPLVASTGPSALFDHYADVNNSGTTETDLYSDTVAANTLAANGDKLVAQYGLSMAGNVNLKTVRVYFAGTSISSTGAAGFQGAFRCDVLLIRSGSTTARAVVANISNGAVKPSLLTETDLTGLDFTATNILKITGQSDTISNDVTAKLSYVQKVPAAVT